MDNNIKNLHNIVDVIEHNFNTEKMKESVLLLKHKMCKTHDLIKQYTEKVREIDRLKSDLEVAKKETKRLISNYKSAMDKIRELELKAMEDKQKNEKLTNKINEYEVNVAADKQTIEQLYCKIKEVEEEHSIKIMEYDLQKSSFKDKIRNLEHELKKSKLTLSQKKRKIGSTEFDTVKQSMETKSSSDIGINVSVSMCDRGLNVKSKLQDKNIMTDEFYNMRDDPYPLFCAKCEIHLPPDLTPEKICKVMSTYPKLIERDLFSPPRNNSSSRLLLNTYPDSTNKNEDALCRVLSIAYPSPCNQNNDSTAGNLKSQSEHLSAAIQNTENIKLGNTNITANMPITTNLSNNLNSVPSTFNSFQSIDCASENFCSDNLLTKHSSSIEEIKRKIQSLENKIKKLRRSKKKLNSNSCCHRCVMNCNNGILLNADLLSIICKSTVEYYNKKREMCLKNEYDIESKKCKCSTRKIKLKKKKRLNKYNVCKNAFSHIWQTENLNEECLQDTLCNKAKDATKMVDILQSEHKLICRNESNSILDVNTSNKFLNDTDESDKREFLNNTGESEKQEFFNDADESEKRKFLNDTDESDKRKLIFHRKNAFHLAEVTSVEDRIMTSHLNTDEIYNKYAHNNLLSEDDVESIETDNQTVTTLSSNDINSIDHADNKIVDTIMEEIKIKRKNQNKDKLGNRLFKKIRNLKRKTQTNSCVNKQENVESCSNDSFKHYELAKKIRIENKDETDEWLLKSTRDLKRTLETRVNSSINKQQNIESCSDHYETAKKLRIAHTPKALPLQPNVIQEDCTHQMLRRIANLEMCRPKYSKDQQLETQIQKNNLLIENEKYYKISKKHNEKNAAEYSEVYITNKKSINEENLDSANDKHCFQNNELDECDNVSVEDVTNECISTDRTLIEMLNNYNKSDILYNDILHNTEKDLEFGKSNLLKASAIIQSEAKTVEVGKEIIPIELEYACNPIGDKTCNNYEIAKDMDVNDELMSNQSAVLETIHYESHNNSHDIGSDKAPKIQHLLSSKDSKIVVENHVNDNNTEESFNKTKNTIDKLGKECVNNEITGIQTIEIQREHVIKDQQVKETKSIHVFHDDGKEYQTPISQLTKYINTKCSYRKMPHKKMTYLCTLIDKFVKKQLQRLINNAWEDSVHYDVIQKLGSTCGPRIIAKCIVEFLSEEINHKDNQDLDKSFTPPAPLMTPLEQKIIALLVDLEMSKPMVIHFVQAAIEYKLFKLNNEMKVQVDSLTRIYVMLSRIQKDREKVRMMCCNALYCMGVQSINVLYTILTCWPEVLPNAETNKEILPKCIAFLIGSQQIEYTFTTTLKKLKPLKTLISTYYNYNYGQQVVNDVVKELMTALKAKRMDGLNTAIILVGKREGPSWTYKNIIKSALLPMIIKNEHTCIYNAFSLLGRLMRAFPLEDEENIVQEISEQLRDLIQSGQGSDDQQEGIISALLSLSRQKFNVVAQSVIKWTPNQPLRSITMTQLQAFINIRNPKFWKSYIQNMHIKSIQNRT